jgi:hypothetical protein
MRPISVSNEPLAGGSRTDALWGCLESLKAFFEGFINMPLNVLTHTVLPLSSAHTFAIVTMTRILFLNGSDWDLALARKSFNLPDVTQRASDALETADQIGAQEEWKRKRKYMDDTRSVLSAHRDKLRWIRAWYMSRVMMPTDHAEPPPAQSSEVNMMDLFPNNMVSPGTFDASFWQVFMDLDESLGGVGGSGGQI